MDVIGMDLSVKTAQLCSVNEAGELVEEKRVRASAAGLRRALAGQPRSLVVMEAGGTSAWVEGLVQELGHETLVVNPRQLKLVAQNSLKTDRVDAELLARLARADAKLLRPVLHRSEQSRRHRALLRVRLTLVEQRKGLINCARAVLRQWGQSVRTGASERFVQRVEKQELPDELRALIAPLLVSISCMDEQIAELERQLEEIAAGYTVVQQLREVDGVGLLVALSFVLCIDDPTRFRKPRDVGPYLGLRPRLWESGEVSRRGRISKEGDAEMRRLLVQAAHVLLHTCKQDSELRRWGLRLQERRGTKVAVVAVARKLAVLMLQLWQTGASYQRFHQQPQLAAVPVQATTAVREQR